MNLIADETLHPNDRGKYWNEQAFRYLWGVDKEYSLMDAERCFKKAISFGDNAALYNLHTLCEQKIIQVPNDYKDKLKLLIDNNVNITTINKTEFIVGNEGIIALALRTALERKMKEILGQNLWNSLPIESRLFNSIDAAVKKGMINIETANEYHDIRKWCNKYHHDDHDKATPRKKIWGSLLGIADEIKFYERLEL